MFWENRLTQTLEVNISEKRKNVMHWSFTTTEHESQNIHETLAFLQASERACVSLKQWGCGPRRSGWTGRLLQLCPLVESLHAHGRVCAGFRMTQILSSWGASPVFEHSQLLHRSHPCPPPFTNPFTLRCVKTHRSVFPRQQDERCTLFLIVVVEESGRTFLIVDS